VREPRVARRWRCQPGGLQVPVAVLGGQNLPDRHRDRFAALRDTDLKPARAGRSRRICTCSGATARPHRAGVAEGRWSTPYTLRIRADSDGLLEMFRHSSLATSGSPSRRACQRFGDRRHLVVIKRNDLAPDRVARAELVTKKRTALNTRQRPEVGWVCTPMHPVFGSVVIGEVDSA
jgi:hypothetical protein